MKNQTMIRGSPKSNKGTQIDLYYDEVTGPAAPQISQREPATKTAYHEGKLYWAITAPNQAG